jgi:hypothetical protein
MFADLGIQSFPGRAHKRNTGGSRAKHQIRKSVDPHAFGMQDRQVLRMRTQAYSIGAKIKGLRPVSWENGSRAERPVSLLPMTSWRGTMSR